MASSIASLAISAVILFFFSNSASLIEDRIQNSGGSNSIFPCPFVAIANVCLNASRPILTAMSERALNSSDLFRETDDKYENMPAIKVESNPESNDPTMMPTDECRSKKSIISRHPSILYLLIGAIVGIISATPGIVPLLIRVYLNR